MFNRSLMEMKNWMMKVPNNLFEFALVNYDESMITAMYSINFSLLTRPLCFIVGTMNKSALSLMNRTISRKLSGKISGSTTFMEGYKKLEKAVLGLQLYQRDEHLKDLSEPYKGRNMKTHLDAFESNYQSYIELGGKQSVHDIAMKLLQSLDGHEKYEQMVTDLRTDAIQQGVDLDLEKCKLKREMLARGPKWNILCTYAIAN